jgi:hypothetical protein
MRIKQVLCIAECPSNSPFLKNNGDEAPKGPRFIVFKEWRDTRTFSNFKSTHCTLLIVLIINLLTKKVCVKYLKYKENDNSAPVHFVHISVVNRGGMGAEESQRVPMMHQKYTHA